MRHSEFWGKMLPDMVGQEVWVYLQGHNELSPDRRYRATLMYVKRGWIGVVFLYHRKLHFDHIPLHAIRKIKVCLSLDKGDEKRFGHTKKRQIKLTATGRRLPPRQGNRYSHEHEISESEEEDDDE